MANTLSDLRLVPTAGPLGVEVHGLDAARPLTAPVVLALKQALNDHHVLIYKAQDLSEKEYLAFASYFGSIFAPPKDVPVLASKDNSGVPPEIVLVSNVEDGYAGSGELSPHADHQWTPLPSSGSLLYALEVPPTGGDTSFFNMHLAYETLEEGTKRQIQDQQLITYNPFVRNPEDPRPKYRLEPKPLVSPVFPHPLVRTHPSSGKKILFLGYATEVELLDTPPEAGAALIEKLRQHFIAERFQYKHRWTVGDIVHWDNQATLHARSAFEPSARRVMKRISLSGSRPF